MRKISAHMKQNIRCYTKRKNIFFEMQNIRAEILKINRTHRTESWGNLTESKVKNEKMENKGEKRSEYYRISPEGPLSNKDK